MDNVTQSKSIAKNTIFLYIRTIFVMGISLYTSRVILKVLGIEDYGIYSIVGGLVSLFTVISGSLSAAISRYLTYELGKKDLEKLKKIYSTSVIIQLLLFFVIVIFAESIGLWFLNYKLVIPSERLFAANWCYQLSLLTFGLNLLSIPYNAMIIAHERMKAFAYFGMIEAIMKLLIVIAASFCMFDKLIFYAISLTLLAFVIRLLYAYYCKKNFTECSFVFQYDKAILKSMSGFAGWNFFGAASGQLMLHGVNIIINLFFGVTVNAARGIAVQVENAVSQFVNNFTTAISPQITKSYAVNNNEYLMDLICSGAKFTYYMFLFFAVPICFETHFLLTIWLGNIPPHTVWFVRLSIILSLIGSTSNTMVTAMLATGNIKRYQIIIGGLGMLVLPFSLLAYYLGYCVEMAYLVNIVIFILQLFFRIFLLHDMINMSINRFYTEVIFRVLFVSILSLIIPSMLTYYFDESFYRFIFLSVCCVFCIPLAIYMVGLKSAEKKYINNFIVNKVIG